jgi:sodium/hydrogen antiporter
VCAIVVAVRRPDMRMSFEGRSEVLIQLVKLGVFFVFGTLLTLDGLFTDGIAAVGVVAVLLLVARPAAVFIALAGTRTDVATRAFMSWFGPKGVATMTFALLVLARDGIAQRERIFDLAALAVLISILLHGITDRPGAAWIGRR